MTNPKSEIRNRKSLVLGIDTGGTYTDGVLLDYDSRRVLAAYKSLTTKRDFSIGIENVIEGIRLEEPAAIKMVSISTTLATNAIAQGNGKRVALLLIGYDPELIASFKLARRFATPHYFFIAGGHNLYGQEKEPLDVAALEAAVDRIKGQVDALAVSAYFSPLNPEHETRAFEVIAGRCDLPVVLGHQLSTRLGSVERATTAALNASLVTVLHEFVAAVRQAMQRRRISAPLMVVRGDGTLMGEAQAARAPVETIHSGPAASAIGGRFLSGVDEALVVDVGGTTTDIALIEAGQVTVSQEGATVGDYKTAVQAANLMSIALGGDSHIRINRENQMTLGPERVVPLAHLAHEHPAVGQQLQTLKRRLLNQATPDWLEYWFLLREPLHPATLNSTHQQALVEMLRQGPQPLPEIVKRLNVLHPLQIDAAEMFRREIIGKAGLTPTDLLHVEGRYTAWDAEAAGLALDAFSRVRFAEPAAIRRQVWAQMTETIVGAIVLFLSQKTMPPPSLPLDTDMGRWFFANSLIPSHPQLETSIRLKLPIIGIGAPAGIVLAGVAERLHTELLLPENHHVANAVGAVAGSVMVSEELLLYPKLSSDGLEVIGFYLQSHQARHEFESAAAALARARSLGSKLALAAALQAGADNPQVVIEEIRDGLDTIRVRAKAVGNPRLGR
ncbi:MAG: hydantoinase/oxoprolinase family protein [Anaerolineae bacterium]